MLFRICPGGTLSMNFPSWFLEKFHSVNSDGVSLPLAASWYMHPSTIWGSVPVGGNDVWFPPLERLLPDRVSCRGRDCVHSLVESVQKIGGAKLVTSLLI